MTHLEGEVIGQGTYLKESMQVDPVTILGLAFVKAGIPVPLNCCCWRVTEGNGMADTLAEVARCKEMMLETYSVIQVRAW